VGDEDYGADSIAFEQVAEDDRWEICMLPLDGIRKLLIPPVPNRLRRLA